MDPARAPDARSLVVELSFGDERRGTVIEPGSELADGETSLAVDLSDLAPAETFDATVVVTVHAEPSGAGAPIGRGERTASLSPDGCNRVDLAVSAAPPVDGGPDDAGAADAEPDAGEPDAEVLDGGEPDAGLCPVGCQAQCAQDCSAGACSCANCPCDLTCPTGACSATCSQTAMCTYTTSAAVDTTVTCQQSATCAVHTEQASSVSVTCRNSAACEITCDQAASCEVDCSQSAQCLLRCLDPAGVCEISSCGGPQMTCPTGEIVCNRACP